MATELPIMGWLLRGHRRALLLWAIALGVVSAIYVSFYPAMGSGEDLEALLEGMPEGLVTALGYDQVGTAAGYLESTVFGLLGPALLLVFAIGAGARLIAGEEEAGTLELELTAPVSRRRAATERFAALTAELVLLAVAVFVVTLVLVGALDMEIGANELAATTVGLLLLVLGMAAIAFAVGAATGRRALALASGAGVAVLSYVANAIAPLLDDGRWLEVVSPFSWYLGSEPLVTGWHAGRLAALAAITVVAVMVSLVTLDRRDLGV